MRCLLAAALAFLPTTCLAQWGNQNYRSYRPRPYIQTTQYTRLQPLQGGTLGSFNSQTIYLPNATFYQDSYGNSGMSAWSGNARFDSFNSVRPIPRISWWGW